MAFPRRLPLLLVVIIAFVGCSGNAHYVDHSGSMAVSVRYGPDAYVPIACEVPMAADLAVSGEVVSFHGHWHLVDGPDDVFFDDPTSSDTTAWFQSYGTYQLIYEVHYVDGYGDEWVTSDNVTVTVADAVYG